MIICAIYRKGDTSLYNKYCGISISSCAYKVFSIIPFNGIIEREIESFSMAFTWNDQLLIIYLSSTYF